MNQCWCSNINCPMHNSKASRDPRNTSRLIWADKNLDCCSKGFLGLFCDARFINKKLQEEINNESKNI